MTEASKCRYKYLDITNGSLLERIKRSLEVPEDIKIVKVISGLREDEFRVVVGSEEFSQEPVGKIPAMVPKFRKPQKYCTKPDHNKPGTHDSNVNPYWCQQCNLPFKI